MMANSALIGKYLTNRFIRNSLRLGNGIWRHTSSTTSSSSIHGIPLTKPVPWIPSPAYATSITGLHQETQVTVLDNGLRVASEPKFGEFCTVGVLIDSGSRYEVFHPSGISHFLEKLAFSSTSAFPNRDSILQKLEQHGGICDCQSSRDTLIYAVSASTDGLPVVIDMLSEVVLRPKVTDEEVENCRTAISFELESLDMRPDPEPLLVEMIHAAAYPENTLGLPKICPPESLGSINRQSVLSFLNNYHTPERMVLAGVGVEHAELVNLANQYFHREPTWMDSTLNFERKKSRDLSVAQYRGGLVKVKKDLSNISPSSAGMPELVHIVIGLESCSHRDPDFVAFCVLNMMMGGGGSFSAGGPGKGMYTRLYLNVLNRFHWIHNATAYNHAYQDSGLFCIHASSEPTNLRELVKTIVRELVGTQYGITESELRRAKTQLQSMLLMNLEARPVHFEDIGRQVLANGRRHQPQYYYDLIEKITQSDIERVARRMLQTKPSVAALGNLAQLPRYDEMQTAINSKDGRIPRRFTLFQ